MRRLSHGLFLALLFAASTRGDEFKLEPGFTSLLNGKDLSGWKMQKGKVALDGKSEAYNGRFKLAGGVISIDPAAKGDVRIETTKTFAGNVHIKFEFKPDAKCNNDLFLRGTKFDIKKGDVKNLKEGEWHQFEIIVTGDMAEFKCNGETQRKLKVKEGATPFELRAEIGGIEVRHIRYKE